MKLFKSLILTLVITLIFTTSQIFCQDTVKQETIKLVPSGEVVGLNIELKQPYVYQRLSEDEKDLEYGDIILSVKYKLKKAKSIDKINEIMKRFFLKMDLKLVDFKLEFGKDSDGKIILADEISPDTCRLWDVNTNEKLDKDRFRRDLGDLVEGYEEVL